MNTSRITFMIIALLLLGNMSLLPVEADATTTFNGSIIVGIDQTQRTVTFKTVDGQSWTLPVADPKILTNEGFSKGDKVSIELDLNDRISKIIKLAGRTDSEQAPSSRIAPLVD